MPPREVLVSVRDVRKDYHGLRPLRVQHLELERGARMAITGIDRPAAEVLTNLITGATLPDEGEVEIFGASTRAITDADHWMRELDRFGILSERVVLLDRFTVEQNLAIPLSLELESMASELRAHVSRLALEVGIAASYLAQPLAGLAAGAQLRLRLGKALALDPAVLVAEHPNALLPPAEVSGFAADFLRVVSNRGIASLVLTADRTFAAAVADAVFTLEPATGELKPAGGWRRWFS
jgi:ABC-type transporter Mla maintaining outer membrane lipid asymmetry ATPase subunit MlaF